MDLLRQDPAASGLLPTAERLMHLQQDLNPLLPPGTADACIVHVSGDDTLILTAASAALAGKLRQLVPSLIAGLTSRGWKVNAIQLRVQPLNSNLKTVTYGDSRVLSKRAKLSSPALDSWAELAGSLDPSPLQDAVVSLLRHQEGSGKTAKPSR